MLRSADDREASTQDAAAMIEGTLPAAGPAEQRARSVAAGTTDACVRAAPDHTQAPAVRAGRPSGGRGHQHDDVAHQVDPLVDGERLGIGEHHQGHPPAVQCVPCGGDLGGGDRLGCLGDREVADRDLTRPLGPGPGRQRARAAAADHGEGHPARGLPGHRALVVGEGHREHEGHLSGCEVRGDRAEPGRHDHGLDGERQSLAVVDRDRHEPDCGHQQSGHRSGPGPPGTIAVPRARRRRRLGGRPLGGCGRR